MTPFNWLKVRTDWLALADKHAGTPVALRFLDLVRSLQDWDGVITKPIIISLPHRQIVSDYIAHQWAKADKPTP